MKFPTGIFHVIASVFGLHGKKKSAVSDPLKKELENRMEEFMERDLFSLVIQPVVNFRKDSVTNGEILSRLNHPDHGMISPDIYLPVVDALGLYPSFDRYIFRKSCAWLSHSLAQGEKLDCVSVNFSRITLSCKDIAKDLIEIADSYGVSHNALAIEITEQVPETGVEDFLENLNQLRAAGFRIILDDFGSGVTSFNDLMRYPLDVVKIDRSLLLEAQTEQGANAYRALVAMAVELGAEVVCEGIETQAQNTFAREAGCHYGQGFLFFKPIAQDQVFAMIRRKSGLDNEV